MRNVARLKMGYYPLPESEGVKLRSLLSLSQLLWQSIRVRAGHLGFHGVLHNNFCHIGSHELPL